MKRDPFAPLAIAIIVLASLALLVIVGCATAKQSVEVTAVYGGDRPEVQASYKVNVP